jgi:quercetin dioxygenase-like cupin family protein
MQITRTSLPIGTEPKEWFADAACVDAVAGPSGPWRLSASKVHVAPGARAAWHSHRNGRTVAARDGAWLVQRRGSAVEVIGPGERAYFEPGEEHWHVAASPRFLTHLGMRQADGQDAIATAGTRVADEEYAAAPAINARIKR